MESTCTSTEFEPCSDENTERKVLLTDKTDRQYEDDESLLTQPGQPLTEYTLSPSDNRFVASLVTHIGYGTPAEGGGTRTLTHLSPVRFCTTNQTTLQSSPQLDADGNIQCAQAEPCPDTSDVFFTDQVVFDRLDQELQGLPKDIFLQNLLDLTQSSEETLANYRHQLSSRAKSSSSQYAPTGILKDRRKSSRHTLAEKYALDCYQLHQFLNKNISDVDEMFKVPNTPQPPSARDHTASSDTSLIKQLTESVSKLQADVLSLKRDISDKTNKLQTVCSDINDVKSEIQNCSKVIYHCIDNVPGTEKMKLSDGLKMLSMKMSRLEKFKTTISSEVSDLKTSVRDNRNNVNRLQNEDYADKSSRKLDIQHLSTKFDDELSNLKTTFAKKSDLDASTKSLSSKIKSSENEQKQSISASIEKSFETFTIAVCNKFDMIGKGIEKSLSAIPDKLSANQKLTTQQDSVITIPDHDNARDLSPVSERPSERSKVNGHQSSVERHKETDRYSDNGVGGLAWNSGQTRQRSNETITSSAQGRTNIPESSRNDRASCESTHHYTENKSPLVINAVVTESRQREAQFKGVVRKRKKTYVLSGISLDSNEEGLHDFLTSLEIVYSDAHFIYSNRTDCKVAKVIVFEEQASILEDVYFWPEGVFCRPWLSTKDYRARQKRNRDYYENNDNRDG